MRLAYFSPLPPSKSGIGDYSAELLPWLAKDAEISVFVDHLVGSNERDGYKVHEASAFDGLNENGRFDLCIYHQRNNPFHEYIYNRAVQDPGLVVLHEHCLHHLIAWQTLGRNDEEGYRDEMFLAYGRRGGEIADMRARDVGSEY